MILAAAQAGAQLERWDLLLILLVGFVAIVGTLAIVGRRAHREADALLWVPNGLERVTAIPGWAAGMIGTAAFGLLVAGIGFYNDVAWHVGRGRDKELFTAPHTMIIVGLGFITVAAGVGILLATLQRVDTRLRVRGLRIPWSAVPLGLLGICALCGFPLDDLWHATYGIDVTMWSPTHMLMICGAAFSLIAAWLALAEAGVPFRQNRWTRVAHFVAAWFVLAGLTAPLGEFRFGVPQFQQLFHPVLLLLAASFAFVPTRIVLGRGWALILAAATFLPEMIGLVSGAGSDFVHTRTPGLYLTSALAVELAAVLFGTERRLRFALASGVGVATIGLAGEWWWNQGAAQPWNGSLLRDALLIGGMVSIGAAVLGAVYGGAVNRQPARIPRVAAVVATLAVLLGLLLPMPRRTSAVTAHIDVQPVAANSVALTVRVDPPDAAQNARWFQAIAWQGGGLKVVGLHPVAPGTYASDEPLPVGGKWKTMLRLHTGAVMMSAPVFLPADPEIGVPEIPAQSRTIPFGGEQQYLMREVKPGPNTVMILAYVIVGLVALLWAGSFVLACVRIPQQRPLRTKGTRRLDLRDPAEPGQEREPSLVS
ncbi:MAG TPA: hypothetical protein VJ831_03405 [Jatrophihabitantaceae bacterium]|nr:hypothetical protein [Jatrophihabitantaceae bacterium]